MEAVHDIVESLLMFLGVAFVAVVVGGCALTLWYWFWIAVSEIEDLKR